MAAMHRMEVVSVHGGLVAACSCGEVYRPASGRGQCFPTWDRPKISAMHRAHKAAS